jgi:hypothetical protein
MTSCATLPCSPCSSACSPPCAPCSASVPSSRLRTSPSASSLPPHAGPRHGQQDLGCAQNPRRVSANGLRNIQEHEATHCLPLDGDATAAEQLGELLQLPRRRSPARHAAIERYLRTGDHEPTFPAWPGNVREHERQGSDGISRARASFRRAHSFRRLRLGTRGTDFEEVRPPLVLSGLAYPELQVLVRDSPSYEPTTRQR